MQEESGEEMLRSNSPSSDGADPGSDSDDEEQPRSFMSVAQTSSMEMSLWSLDASATSSMEASLTAETEVWTLTATHLRFTRLVLSSSLIWRVF